MSIKSCERIEKNTIELKLSADAAAFADSIAKAYAKNKGKYNAPGFRRGKAPKSLIEKMYGEKVFYEDALEILYPRLYEEAVTESNIKPVDTPYDVDVPEIGKDGVEITLKVTVEPEVEVKKYKGLTAKKEAVKVTGAEVNAEIDKALEQNARTLTIDDRAVKSGDTVIIDFEGFVDEAAFEGGKGENHSLEIGSNSFIPGFEDAIIGHKTGEEFDVNVPFPTEYHEKKLAGKEAVFKVKLHEIKVKELPVLDEEFVKDVSEFNTVEEYKKDIKANILERKEKAAKEAFDDAVIDALCENVVAEIPDIMIEKSIDENIGDFEYRLKMQGLSIDMYLQYIGMDMPKLREQYKEKAEKQVKLRLALMKIAELEKIEANEDDKNKEIEKYAKAYGMDAEKIKKSIPVLDLENDIIRQKAMELVINKAVASNPAAKETEKKAQSPADSTKEEKKPVKKTVKATAVSVKEKQKKESSASSAKKTQSNKEKKAPVKKTTEDKNKNV